jgi:pyruvate/2-oxoglutarate dehydrogenase complex dihydrolipoamide acyltransferase (E2) component
MNEIPAESMCVVREVCCANADPVEFDQVLFYVEPVASAAGQDKNTNEQA